MIADVRTFRVITALCLVGMVMSLFLPHPEPALSFFGIGLIALSRAQL